MDGFDAYSADTSIIVEGAIFRNECFLIKVFVV